LSRGCTLLLIGLFKKVILADSLGGISDALFGRAAEGTARAGPSWPGAGCMG